MTTANINERSNSLFAAALGGGAILIGLLLLFGNGDGPTNQLMRELAPLNLWGAAFISTGLAGTVGQITRRWTLITISHAAGAALAATVAACFYVAATAREMHASLHGAGVYLTVAVMHLLVALISRPPR